MNALDRNVLMPFILLALLTLSGNSIAQSFNGGAGLINIPTAELLRDGEISFGLNWMDTEYVAFTPPQYNAVVSHISLGFLPFFEITARLTSPQTMHPPPYYGVGDREVILRLKIINEREIIPALTLGLQDPIGTSVANSSYLVVSKGFSIFDSNVGCHIGYGVDWLDAKGYQFIGLFGGIMLSPKPYMDLMVEYDGEKPNFGVRIGLKGFGINLALLNFDAFSGGLSYRIQMH